MVGWSCKWFNGKSNKGSILNLHFLLLSKLSRSLNLPTASDPKHETKIYFQWNYHKEDGFDPSENKWIILILPELSTCPRHRVPRRAPHIWTRPPDQSAPWGKNINKVTEKILMTVEVREKIHYSLVYAIIAGSDPDGVYARDLPHMIDMSWM